MARGEKEFDEHIRCRSVSPPPTLYKYATAPTARQILTTRKLRHQSPLKYNDPFDSQCDPMWCVRTDDYANKERAIWEQALRDPATWPLDIDPEHRAALQNWVSQIAHLAPDRREAEQENLHQMLDARRRQADKAIEEETNDLRGQMRVLCLCERDDSTLMWSRYADEHRGVVLGFDVNKYERHYKRPFEKITYSREPPVVFDLDIYAKHIIFGLPAPTLHGGLALVLTKSQCWDYEREWRFVWAAPAGTNGDHSDFDFPPEALVEVVFGNRTCECDKKELSDLARRVQRHVSVASMTLHYPRFELVKSQI